MIDTKELRIGNIVEFAEPLFDTGFKQVTSIGHHINQIHPSYIKPIPLTEEWLFKAGFEKFGFNELIFKNITDDAFYIGIDKTGDTNDGVIFVLSDQTEKDGEIVTKNYLPHIKYVHQLQNLYFCLTGEELTINP